MNPSRWLAKDKQVVGKSFFLMYEYNDVFVLFDKSGFSRGNRLILEEVNIQYQQEYSNVYFC